MLGTLVRDTCALLVLLNEYSRTGDILFAVCSLDVYIGRTAMEAPVVFGLTSLPRAPVFGTAYVRKHIGRITNRSSTDHRSSLVYLQ